MDYIKLVGMLVIIAAIVAGFYFFLGVALAVAVFAMIVWFLSSAAEALWDEIRKKFR